MRPYCFFDFICLKLLHQSPRPETRVCLSLGLEKMCHVGTSGTRHGAYVVPQSSKALCLLFCFIASTMNILGCFCRSPRPDLCSLLSEPWARNHPDPAIHSSPRVFLHRWRREVRGRWKSIRVLDYISLADKRGKVFGTEFRDVFFFYYFLPHFFPPKMKTGFNFGSPK